MVLEVNWPFLNIGRPERALCVHVGGMGGVLMVTIGFTSSLVRFHTVVGTPWIEVFSVVRGKGREKQI